MSGASLNSGPPCSRGVPILKRGPRTAVRARRGPIAGHGPDSGERWPPPLHPPPSGSGLGSVSQEWAGWWVRAHLSRVEALYGLRRAPSALGLFPRYGLGGQLRICTFIG